MNHERLLVIVLLAIAIFVNVFLFIGKGAGKSESHMTSTEMIEALKMAKTEEIDQIRRLLRIENSYTSVKIDPRTGKPKEE